MMANGDYYYLNPIHLQHWITSGNTPNYQLVYNPPYTYQSIDSMPKSIRLRCKYCWGIVFDDERECPGCGAREFYDE